MIPLTNICVYVNTVEVKVVTTMRNWINSRNYTLECIWKDINKSLNCESIRVNSCVITYLEWDVYTELGDHITRQHFQVWIFYFLLSPVDGSVNHFKYSWPKFMAKNYGVVLYMGYCLSFRSMCLAYGMNQSRRDKLIFCISSARQYRW